MILFYVNFAQVFVYFFQGSEELFSLDPLPQRTQRNDADSSDAMNNTSDGNLTTLPHPLIFYIILFTHCKDSHLLWTSCIAVL